MQPHGAARDRVGRENRAFGSGIPAMHGGTLPAWAKQPPGPALLDQARLGPAQLSLARLLLRLGAGCWPRRSGGQQATTPKLRSARWGGGERDTKTATKPCSARLGRGEASERGRKETGKRMARVAARRYRPAGWRPGLPSPPDDPPCLKPHCPVARTPALEHELEGGRDS